MVWRGGESTAAAAPAGPLTHARQAAASVIPAPASLAAGRGAFAVREPRRFVMPPEPAAAGSALYFVDLMRSSHPAWLEVIERGGAPVPERAIAFRLEPALPGASPE